ncbi:MAG: MFS transporter [Xanthomonadales bacterium]|nr:MFS transporter [Gammaproteobacteria bacterium]NNJ65263.1 MFS transporter [Xanthomonadales bacterium]NNK32770.1 MFS transporter [Xanthomonadales bacterium]
MTAKTGVLRQFPRSFWAANTMEIFERMGWYGFYAVSALYLTGPVEDGGLGFSSADRGVIQGLATFFLYLFPAVFGALADRYGYKNMFLASAAVMAPAYLLLALPTGFWAFLGTYFLVAVGHGMFKPVVISTVAKATNEENGSVGFGIFYMMVNVGGFIGPIFAGVVRGWDWNLVFYASSAWIVIMAVVCLLIYREPPRDAEAERQRSLGDVFRGMVEVVGNLRFFVLVSGLLVMLVMGSRWWSFSLVGVVAAAWLAGNLLLDVVLRGMKSPAETRAWFAQPMAIGEGRYLLFLLLMAGFWVSFNQIFMTLPEYIRDYVDTSDLIAAFGPLASGITGFAGGLGFDTSEWSRAVLENGQVKPEHLINLNAFGIILFQVLISFLMRKTTPLTSIIAGVCVTIASFGLYLVGMTGWIVVSAILVFSLGEMMASPRSKEYAGRIAPPEKVGMYMGYFYWCVALGNLFGGLLSGLSYQHFGPQGVNRPDQMWILFASLAGITAVSLVIYNRWMMRGSRA